MARFNKLIKDDKQHKAWTSQRIRELQKLQSLPLPLKLAKTEWLISEAVDRYGINAVAVSNSMGKDSGVLSHILRQLYPDVLNIYANTGCEYPECVKLYRKQAQEFNLIMISPRKGWTFKKVVEEYGYPMFSKYLARLIYCYHLPNRDKQKLLKYIKTYFAKYVKYIGIKLSDKCCELLKHGEIKKYQRSHGIKCAIIGTLATESMLRKMSWVDYGCNVFEKTRDPRSRPMSFWTERDVWAYIREFDVEIADIYRMGYTRNGCVFCGFGVHLDKTPNRIQRLAWTHPHMYRYLVRHFKQYFDDCDIDITPVGIQTTINF